MKRQNFGWTGALGPTLDGGYAGVYAATAAQAELISRGEAPEQLWIGQHPLTVTLGRSLKAKSQVGVVPAHVPVVEIERGGGATLHNPGQVVAYPLLRLEQHALSPVTYLRVLEQCIISVLASYGVTGEAIAGQTGVWVAGRKVASLGVSVVSGVTRHGLALNVANSLHDFSLISPCGFSPDIMTRLVDLQPTATFEECAERLCFALLGALELRQ